MRYEALQTLCSAPPSDVLNCENWTTLCEKLTVYLSDPDPVFSVRKCLQKYKHFLFFFPYHSRSKWNIIFFNSSSNIYGNSPPAFELSSFFFFFFRELAYYIMIKFRVWLESHFIAKTDFISICVLFLSSKGTSKYLCHCFSIKKNILALV